jgi:hypothetical protein
VMPCEQCGDREVGLVAVKVEELSMTADAAGAFVWQCHLEVMVHRFRVFAQAEEPGE